MGRKVKGRGERRREREGKGHPHPGLSKWKGGNLKTDRQTERKTNKGYYITSLAEVTKVPECSQPHLSGDSSWFHVLELGKIHHAVSGRVLSLSVQRAYTKTITRHQTQHVDLVLNNKKRIINIQQLLLRTYDQRINHNFS